MSVAFDEHIGPWTVTDVLGLPEDSHQRIELVDGALMMSPAPGLPHQRAAYRLHRILDTAAEAAGAAVEVFDTINVLVPDGLLIPDLAIVESAAAETAGITVHAADVLAVVEIASPGTRTVDRKVKTQLYAAAGIPHYWRIDLEPTPRITVGELLDGAYADRLPVTAGATARIDRPFPIEFDPALLTSTRP